MKYFLFELSLHSTDSFYTPGGYKLFKSIKLKSRESWSVDVCLLYLALKTVLISTVFDPESRDGDALFIHKIDNKAESLFVLFCAALSERWWMRNQWKQAFLPNAPSTDEGCLKKASKCSSS
ncbi:hypothetical protein XENOCAPTIV_019718 [Xenoophorus captivus]|uniref:Uncharacterized protein n=1 Tax=Xenoophorus captivus TaxID=1517983 RepID=A0ABV0RTG7_9TELE